MNRCAELWDRAARTRRLLLQTTDEATRIVLAQAVADLERQATSCVANAGAQELRTSREFYASENGDTWSLSTDASGSPVVVHQANQPSGGTRTEYEVGSFLSVHRRHTPEHDALLRLVATVMDRQ